LWSRAGTGTRRVTDAGHCRSTCAGGPSRQARTCASRGRAQRPAQRLTQRKEGETRNKRSVVCIQNRSLHMHKWPGLHHHKFRQRCPKIQNSGRIRSGPSDNRGDPARSPPSPGCESYVAGGWEGFIVPYTLSSLLERSRPLSPLVGKRDHLVVGESKR
jgi:hypothetical protein